MTDWQTIGEHITQATGEPFRPVKGKAMGGGCINATLRLGDGRRSFFVKLNQAERLEMFAAEAEGLAEIAASATLRVPQPICHGVAGGQAYLVLEYIELKGDGDAARAGEQLAHMHHHLGNGFGWHRDNTIGSTHQPNTRSRDWAEFFRDRRLGHQIRLAARNGHGGRLLARGEALLEEVPALLEHTPQPSLLHGDLWNGNLAYAPDGAPVLFDPAVYYGDRETDIAMTELFGGFGPAFYQGYKGVWPLHDGYPTRRELYNLYHVLNHLNMFGGGYGAQALRMVDRLMAQLGH